GPAHQHGGHDGRVGGGSLVVEHAVGPHALAQQHDLANPQAVQVVHASGDISTVVGEVGHLGAVIVVAHVERNRGDFLLCSRFGQEWKISAIERSAITMHKHEPNGAGFLRTVEYAIKPHTVGGAQRDELGTYGWCLCCFRRKRCLRSGDGREEVYNPDPQEI